MQLSIIYAADSFMTISVYLYINLIAIIIWIIVNKRLGKHLNLLGIYLLVMFCTEMAAWVYSKTLHESNHWMYNILTNFEILYLCFVYNKIMVERKLFSYQGIWLISFVCFSLANIIFIQGFWKFNTYTYMFGCAIIFFYFIQYLMGLLNSHEIIPLYKIPFFWITLGNILFFSGSFFYMGAINYILEKRIDKSATMLSTLVYSFAAIQYCLFITGFICNLKPKQKYLD
jgi:hypothetical protein